MGHHTEPLHLASVTLPEETLRIARKNVAELRSLLRKTPGGRVQAVYDEDDNAHTVLRAVGYTADRTVATVAEYVGAEDAALIEAWYTYGPGLLAVLQHFLEAFSVAPPRAPQDSKPSRLRIEGE